MKKPFDILIVGAGLAGLTLAALLAQGRSRKHIRLSVVDRAPRPQVPDGHEVDLRVSAVSTGSASLLESVGAWSRIESSRICPYDRMCVWDARSVAESDASLRFDAAEFSTRQLGFIVENVRIRNALIDLVESQDVELRFDADLESFDADLVVGADGANSFVRQKAGIGTRDYPYDQFAFVTHLRPEKPHRNTAWQRFLEDGPLGILPMADGRVSVVWSTTGARAETAMKATDEELGQMLSGASDHVLGQLQASGQRGVFALVARHAEHYVQSGIALVGDAAHAVHPLAGQGANLGFRDAAILARVIDEAVCNNEFPGDRPVLRRYERARKGENVTMLHFMTGLNRLFTTDSALVSELRAIGMRLFNHSGPIREFVVKVALGR